MSRKPASGRDAHQNAAGSGMPLEASADVAPIDCETAVRRLWDYLDGGLDAPTRGEVQQHLATCAKCPPHFSFAASTLAASAAARPSVLSPAEESALRARVRRTLVEAGMR